uniref:THAP domain-containing protein 1 n=1 Tax=Monopterus albus TaxID=43700 RepID=A0A3Q3JD27_MONAL
STRSLTCSSDYSVVLTSFHYLPKVPLLRQKWLEFIYQSRAHTLTGVDVIRICSAHFSEESFFNYMQKAQGFAKKLILKPNAVPTFYPGTPTAKCFSVIKLSGICQCF